MRAMVRRFTLDNVQGATPEEVAETVLRLAFGDLLDSRGAPQKRMGLIAYDWCEQLGLELPRATVRMDWDTPPYSVGHYGLVRSLVDEAAIVLEQHLLAARRGNVGQFDTISLVLLRRGWDALRQNTVWQVLNTSD